MTFEFHSSPVWKFSPLATFLFLMRPGGIIFSSSKSRKYHKVLLSEVLSFLLHVIFQQHMECKFTSCNRGNKRRKPGGNKHCKQVPSKRWGSYHTALPSQAPQEAEGQPSYYSARYDLHIFEDFSLLQLHQSSTSFRIYVITGKDLVDIMQ